MQILKIFNFKLYNYSERPKSERSDFGVFRFGSVPKLFGFQTFSLLTLNCSNQTKSSDFRRCSNDLKIADSVPALNQTRPVPKRFCSDFGRICTQIRRIFKYKTGSKPVLFCLEQIFYVF